MTENIKILVIDDSPETLEMIERILKPKGYKILLTTNGEDGIKILRSEPIDLVITDLKMPGITGLDLLRFISENFKDIQSIVITGYPSIDTAVLSIKSGAEEFLPKPFTDEELLDAINKSIEKIKLKYSIYKNKSVINEFGIIGESMGIKKVITSIKKAAQTNATVLIYGESGTGKELVARAIHYNSLRATSPFVAVNCGGIPESLLESQLFGHLKGAFTGATETRAGFFQTADKGTIFLDEITETSPSTQVKLLRVLQEKEIYMVGSNKSIKIDTRIIAATNRDIMSLVRQGKFREDLYFRLNVIPIDIPPLRERGNDIIMLTNYFLDLYKKEYNKPELTISDDVLKIFVNYSWPGNVRELQNLIQRIVVMSDNNFVDIPDLPEIMRFSISPGYKTNMSLEDVEREHISNVLKYTNYNKTRAAEILKVDRKTLRDKIKKYKIIEKNGE
ncbi:MAG: sigma-54 dependent transcriptional regulator [Deltaproteobacteria bacterium]|nr:sigma-54 dependent transcriptional regulator [Deltaproteobacteria bacterium]